MIDHYKIAALVHRADSWDRCYPGNLNVEVLVADLTKAARALNDEVTRLRDDRKQGGLDYCDLMKRHDAHFVAWQSAKSRAEKAEAERDALRAALVEHNDLLRSASQIAKREGIDGEIASTNWDAYYNRVAVVLKRHHEIANTARAALKGDDNA